MRHCTPLLFGLDLPGSRLFIMDILNAVNLVLNSDAIKNVSEHLTFLRVGIGLLSLRLSISQGVSLAEFLLAPACPIEKVTPW